MNDMLEINRQIEVLTKKAVELKKKNRPAVVIELREKMQAYGITAKEIALPSGRGRKAGPAKAVTGDKPAPTVKPKKKSGSVAAKYRGPDGQTWTGRGLAPKWLTALIASGRTKDEFLIPAADTPATAS